MGLQPRFLWNFSSCKWRLLQLWFLVEEANGNFIRLFIFANLDAHDLRINKVILSLFVVENMPPALSRRKRRDSHWWFRLFVSQGNFIQSFIFAILDAHGRQINKGVLCLFVVESMGPDWPKRQGTKLKAFEDRNKVLENVHGILL